MLDEQITRFVHEAVRIKAREFEHDLAMRLMACDSSAAKTGNMHGSRHYMAYLQECQQDLRNRAQFTFIQIQRAVALYPQRFDDTLKANLIALQFTETRAQCTAIQRQLEQRVKHAPHAGRSMGSVYSQLNDECDHLTEKYTLEMEAFKQAQRNAPVSSEAGGVVINGPVGVVQTGAYATASQTLNIGHEARDAMLKALDLASDALTGSQQLAAEHQRQMLDVVEHLRDAVRKPQPNPSLIRGMFDVLSTTLITLASTEGAMAALRAAALPFGIAI